MSLGRRKIGIADTTAWVFNRMADAYAARPAYPEALLNAVAALAPPISGRVLEIGAGIGHVALPLARRGLEVTVVEPALAMLDQLKQAASALGLSLRALHAAAEALPLAPDSADLVVVADALHFLDVTLAAGEASRVLAPRGRLAIVTCEFGDTPWMRAVAQLMQDSAPRRVRVVTPAITQMFRVVDIAPVQEQRFQDETPMDATTLERLVRSISFIGPAMNVERFAEFRRRLQALPGEAVWARSFTLYSGQRRR